MDDVLFCIVYHLQHTWHGNKHGIPDQTQATVDLQLLLFPAKTLPSCVLFWITLKV